MYSKYAAHIGSDESHFLKLGSWCTEHISLSTIRAYNGYQPCHRVLWINPAANIPFSVTTLETARI